MTRVATEPQQTKASSHHRSRTGSILFPDLVWAHYEWQSRTRPHEFRAVEVVTRAGLRRLVFWRRRDRQSSHRANNVRPPAAPSRDVDVSELKEIYETELDKFQDGEGDIIRSYWCSTEASAVVLTEKKKRFSWLPWRRVGSFELHRVTEWVTEEAPRIAELLHSGDTLTIRVNRVLNATPRRIALEWIFSEQNYLLGFVERTGSNPRPDELESTVRRHQEEIDRLERYYDRAASKAARIWYFGGMVVGLFVVIGLGALIPFVITPFGDIDLATTSMRRFYACFVAGAVGAMVSVMTRMRDEDRISLDYEVGELLILMLGGFRPVLGAIFGVVAYFAIDSGFVALTPPPGGTPFLYYALFAFLAGFSERFAHVILGKADLTLAKSEAGADTSAPAIQAASGAATPVAAEAGVGARANGRALHATLVAPARTKEGE
jgi:hypothetical protein